jgi:hypothetical protein
MLTTLLTLQIITAAASADPFAFFQPSFTITADDRRQLDRGEPIARVLPAKDLEVALLAAVPVNIDGDRLVTWIRRIEELKKSAYVLAIRRFSDPPRIEDLAGLTLEDEELSEIVDCRPGRCGVKLSAAEMSTLRRAAAEAGDAWKAALQDEFRRVALARVNAYLSGELIGPFENHGDRIWPAQEFASLIDHSTFLVDHLPDFAEQLRAVPRSPHHGVESFLYWSKERVANRPIISVTHVNIIRGDDASSPDVLVAGKEIFSMHYINASLGLTALMRGEPGGPNYLVYVNRSQVDVLHGMFAGIIRWFMQRRLKAEAANVLQGLRRRLESGEPPPVIVRGSP